MKQKGIVVVMFDAPSTAEFTEWAQGKHMEDCGKVPGVTRVRRYVVVEGPPDKRTNLSITEYDDMGAALAYRGSDAAQLVRQDANAQGVTNRYTLTCREIFSITFEK